MRGNRLAVLLAAFAFGCAMSASASLHITPSTDPGNIEVGDTLTFTVSIDTIAPPDGDEWDEIVMSLFRISGPTNGFNFTGTCTDLSGLSIVTKSCPAGSNGAFWRWSSFGGTAPVSGNLFSFEGLFNEAGTYRVFLESATASFEEGEQQIPFDFRTTNPVLIHVSEASVPEPATLALLGLGLAGLGFSRRKQ